MGEFKSGWRALLVGFTGMLLGFPTVPLFTIGLLGPAISQETQLSFGFLLSGLAIATTTLALLAPAIGWLADWTGGRKIAIAGMAVFPLFYMLLPWAVTSKPLYVAAWILMGIAGCGASPTVWVRLIARNFELHRGLAMGIALTGTGVFTILGKPVMHSLIVALGWRHAAVVMGLVQLVIALPIVAWGYRDAGAARGGVDRPKLRPTLSVSGASALRDPRFWLLLGSFAALALGASGPVPNLERILGSQGFTPGQVLSLTALLGMATITGRLVAGWLLDRIWAPFVGLLVVAPGGLGCALLAFPLPMPLAALAVVLLGLALSAELDLLGYLVARYFGRASFGLLYGAAFAAFSIFAGLGPALVAHFYDRNHDYRFVLTGAGGLIVAAAFILLFLGRYPAATFHQHRSPATAA